MKFKHEIKQYLTDNLSADMRKRLRPKVYTNNAFRNGDNFVSLNIPTYINVDVDDSFLIEKNDITVKFRNKKVNVTIWYDENVPAHIVIY